MDTQHVILVMLHEVAASMIFMDPATGTQVGGAFHEVTLRKLLARPITL